MHDKPSLFSSRYLGRNDCQSDYEKLKMMLNYQTLSVRVFISVFGFRRNFLRFSAIFWAVFRFHIGPYASLLEARVSEIPRKYHSTVYHSMTMDPTYLIYCNRAYKVSTNNSSWILEFWEKKKIWWNYMKQTDESQGDTKRLSKNFKVISLTKSSQSCYIRNWKDISSTYSLCIRRN